MTTLNSGSAPEVALPLDQLLSQAALNPVRRMIPGMSGVRFAAKLAEHPKQLAARLGGLAGELGRVAAGTSDVTPSKRDRRFADPAWSNNPLLRRVLQAYLATSETVEGLLQDVPLEWRDAERVGFVATNLLDALAPSNSPLLNPLAWKALIDTGGKNLIDGPRHLLEDMSSPPRVPTMVERDAYTVGVDLAVAPGKVVARTPVLELIQYTPTTDKVKTAPVLVIPPTINKYYVLDLAPGRSFVEYLVAQGQQVFMISWRNPDARHREWGIDTYVGEIIEALGTVEEITGASETNLMAVCSGGILTSLATAYLAQTEGLDRVASLTLLVTMLDQSQAGVASAITDETAAEAAVASSQRKGYLDGRSLAEVFSWLRPNDLIWNYWVNNYLEGKKPPKFDILYWNGDTTRMTANLHRDFVESSLTNGLARPGGVTVLGTEIDLGEITSDTYVVAGINDHICPWTNCYRSGQLLGGKVRFVLSTSGHIAAMVNPPGNPKARFQVSEDNSPEAAEWSRTAPTEQGSWWSDYATWLGERSGKDRPAPAAAGSEEHPPVGDAPGTYVRET